MRSQKAIMPMLFLGSVPSGFVYAEADPQHSLVTLHNFFFLLVGLFIAAGIYYKQLFMKRKNKRIRKCFP